jgi:MFS transporter, DHA1 family, inner membrane transport protein
MRLRLVVLALGTFAMGLDTFVIAPILGPMGSDLGVSRATAGQLVTAYALAYAISGPLLAAAFGHRRPRGVLLGALAVFGLGNALTAVAPSYAVAVLSRVVAGAGASMYTANALAVARRLVPGAAQGRAVATVVGGLTTAIVFGVPIGAWLGATTGWRLTLWLVVALTVVATAGIALAIPDLDGRPGAGLRARLAPLRDRHVLAIVAATALCLASSWTAYNYIGQVLRPATDGDAGRASLVLLFFGAGAVVGNLLAGRLADRDGPAHTIAMAAPGLTAAVTAAALLGTTMASALALVLVWGVLHWMINVPQQLRVTAAAPDAAPLVLGLHQTAIYVGIAIGGIAGAAGLAVAGRPGIGYAASVVGVVALAVLVLSFRLDPARVRSARPAPC